ncbi:MAG: MerC domain-containing protein [Gammaproteobacteria bacterium]|nr:MerC domain-containing protein [Gammaproteobacteria bacterium]
MKKAKQNLAWLGSITSLLAVATCYGTLAAVSLLSLIGVSVHIDEATLVKLITTLLVFALAGMLYSWRSHRHPGPLMLSLGAGLLLLWVFYGSYSKPLEIMGFILLIIASLWDFRVKKRICTGNCDDQNC